MDYGLFGGLKPEPELVAVTNGVEQGAAAASHAAPLYAQSGAGPGAGFPGGASWRISALVLTLLPVTTGLPRVRGGHRCVSSPAPVYRDRV